MNFVSHPCLNHVHEEFLGSKDTFSFLLPILPLPLLSILPSILLSPTFFVHPSPFRLIPPLSSVLPLQNFYLVVRFATLSGIVITIQKWSNTHPVSVHFVSPNLRHKVFIKYHMMFTSFNDHLEKRPDRYLCVC